jgi:hypothetical protein
MVDIDIDIWGRGRDAAKAGRITERAMLAGYPSIEIPSQDINDKMCLIIADNLERNHNGQPVYRFFGLRVFFQYQEDRDLCRALLYIY